jgi:superfamily II DNA/RNA helicase
VFGWSEVRLISFSTPLSACSHIPLLQLQAAGFKSPTPIQAQSWPIAMQNRDIVAIAKTGSGKTLGYLIPAFLHLEQHRSNSRLGPTVLVLAPTRELATQIQEECVKFGRSSRITSTVRFEALNTSITVIFSFFACIMRCRV